MNDEEKYAASNKNALNDTSKMTSTEKKNFTEKPIYVYFEHDNKKISELIIPDPKLNLEQLITEKANFYDIEKNTFIDLVYKNKIDLSDKCNTNYNSNTKTTLNNENNDNKNKYCFNDKNTDNENYFAEKEFMSKEKCNQVIYASENNKNKENYSNNLKNYNYAGTLNELGSCIAKNFNYYKTDYILNKNGINGYNFTKSICELNNLDNFNQPKNKTYDYLDTERNLYEIPNISNESSVNKSNRHVNNDTKHIPKHKGNNTNNSSSNNNNKSQALNNNNSEFNKKSKKMNIIRNLKKAGNKIYKEEFDKRATNNNNYIDNTLNNYSNNNTISNSAYNYIHNHKILNVNNKNIDLNNNSYCNGNGNVNGDFNQGDGETSKQKIRGENHFSDKSRDISSKSTNINDAIKTNLKNQKESGLSLLNNSNKKKINKIFNMKFNKNIHEVSKFKDKFTKNNRIEFLTEREKENFSMLYSLTSNNEKFFIDNKHAKTATGKFSSNINNIKTYNNNNNHSSSAYDSKQLISISAANLNPKSSFRFKNSSKNNIVNNNNMNCKAAKKINFHRIKGLLSAEATATSKEFAAPEETIKSNKFNNNSNNLNIYNITKSNSNVNILSYTNNINFNNNNTQLCELESLYNTDCENLKSYKNRRNLLSNKFSSINSISKLYLTQKTFFTQHRKTNKSLDPHFTIAAQRDLNLTYKPKLNHNSIFMNLRKKYSKLLELEQENEKSTNSNNIYNNDSNINRKNKLKINYVSKTEANEFSQVRSRGRSVDEINCITNRLYDYAARYNFRKRIKEEDYYNSTCPFTPYLINDVYKLNNIKPSMRNFFYRLQSWVDKRNLKYETDYECTLYDDKTGEKLFSPRINKGDRNNSRRNVYIFCFLSIVELNFHKVEKVCIYFYSIFENCKNFVLFIYLNFMYKNNKGLLLERSHKRQVFRALQ